jgi:hypothetical protein
MAVLAVDVGAEQPERVAVLPAGKGVQILAERHGGILVGIGQLQIAD